jgi:hypothetical protein
MEVGDLKSVVTRVRDNKKNVPSLGLSGRQKRLREDNFNYFLLKPTTLPTFLFIPIRLTTYILGDLFRYGKSDEFSLQFTTLISSSSDPQ